MSEHDEQVLIFDFALRLANRYPELDLLYAIPNGGELPYRRISKNKVWSPERAKLIQEGMKPGVPDMCLPVARNGFHGLYIELKFKDNKPTAEQEVWINKLVEQGYLAVVCWGGVDAIENICEYLGIPKDTFSWA